jgi:hypothetical protein
MGGTPRQEYDQTDHNDVFHILEISHFADLLDPLFLCELPIISPA